MVAPLVGALLTGVGTGIAGSLFGGKKDDKSAELLERALAEFSNIPAPDIETMKVKLDQFVQQGLLTPEEAGVVLQGKSELSGISGDQEGMNAAKAALAGLSDVYTQGGMTAIDEQRLREIQDAESSAERGSREAIIQNAQARGVGGSGLELASKLTNQQAAAGRVANQGVDVAAEAQKRALEAMVAAGSTGLDINKQTFGQEATKATAQDVINQFNTQNKQNVGFTNVAARNRAQEANLAEKQRVADTNVGIRNQQETRNKNLIQQDFQNKLDLARGKSGQLNTSANAAATSAAADAEFNRGLVDTAIKTGLSTYTALDDEEKKKNPTAVAAASGGRVPGDPLYPGDDERNDTVIAALSPDEVVVPRTVAQDPEAAAEFVQNAPEIPASSVDPVVAKALMDKYGAGERARLIERQRKPSTAQIVAEGLAGITDAYGNAYGRGTRDTAGEIRTSAEKRNAADLAAFDQGRAEGKFERESKQQSEQDDPQSELSRTTQGIVARLTGQDATDPLISSLSYTKAIQLMPFIKEDADIKKAELAAKTKKDVEDTKAGAKVKAAEAAPGTYEAKEDIKQKTKAKKEYFDAKSFVPGSITILDELVDKNKNSYSGKIGGGIYSIMSATDIGTDTETFKNTADIVNSLRQMVSKVLKATFGGQLSDGERAYLDAVHGASPTYSKAERDIAIKNVKRMMEERLAEKKSAYELWSGGDSENAPESTQPKESAGETKVIGGKTFIKKDGKWYGSN